MKYCLKPKGLALEIRRSRSQLFIRLPRGGSSLLTWSQHDPGLPPNLDDKALVVSGVNWFKRGDRQARIVFQTDSVPDKFIFGNLIASFSFVFQKFEQKRKFRKNPAGTDVKLWAVVQRPWSGRKSDLDKNVKRMFARWREHECFLAWRRREESHLFELIRKSNKQSLQCMEDGTRSKSLTPVSVNNPASKQNLQHTREMNPCTKVLLKNMLQ